MPKTMPKHAINMPKKVHFAATLTYKIKMFKCIDLVLDDPLSHFQGLRGPHIGQTSKDLTVLSTSYGQNPPR